MTGGRQSPKCENRNMVRVRKNVIALSYVLYVRMCLYVCGFVCVRTCVHV